VKQFTYSPTLVAALATVYPAVKRDANGLCTFRLDKKFMHCLDFELERFKFSENPLCSLALTLSSYGNMFYYDFSFGEAFHTVEGQTAFDSFDYATQWKTAATAGAPSGPA
jgi:hypothetical protein